MVLAGEKVFTSDINPAWQTYTPVIGGSGSPTLGNGTVNAARYLHLGFLVVVQIDLSWGSTSSWGSGVGNVSLPVTARSTSPAFIGKGILTDTSAGTSGRKSQMVLLASTTTVNFNDDATGAFQSNTSPFTWASGDLVRIFAIYEPAASP